MGLHSLCPPPPPWHPPCAAGAIATASFVDPSQTDSNFGKLRVSTFPQFPDELQASAAGFLEGWLSAERIFDQHTNLFAYFQDDLYPGMDLELGMQWWVAWQEGLVGAGLCLCVTTVSTGTSGYLQGVHGARWVAHARCSCKVHMLMHCSAPCGACIHCFEMAVEG